MSLALLERPTARSIPTTSTIFAEQGQGQRQGQRRQREHSRRLSAAEERSLAGRTRRGDRQAIELLVLANLGLVGNIAHVYEGRGLSFDDLYQEGIRGLIRACADFDPDAHDNRFSTYASCWIRHTIKRALATSGAMIRLPVYMIRLRSEYRRTLGKIQAEEIRDEAEGRGKIARGTDHDIASRMGINLATLDLIRQTEIERTQFHGEDDEEDSISFEEMIADTSDPHFDLDIFEEMECLREGIALLSPHEAWLIRHRFGLDEDRDRRETMPRLRDMREDDGPDPGDPEPKSLKWVAQAFGRSLVQIKRMESSALVKLRDHMRKRVGEE